MCECRSYKIIVCKCDNNLWQWIVTIIVSSLHAPDPTAHKSISVFYNCFVDKELMAFACQRNSYLKELVSKVISCVKIKDGFEVILNDTVIFPEGGGQVSFVFLSQENLWSAERESTFCIIAVSWAPVLS